MCRARLRACACRVVGVRAMTAARSRAAGDKSANHARKSKGSKRECYY